MANQEEINNVKELLSPNILKNPSRFLEILERFDSEVPSRETATIVKKAMGMYSDPVIVFLLKKSFRLAAFKLKGAAFKVSLNGLEKLLNSPERLDDLALAVASINNTEAFLASDYFKTANWKFFPTSILPCFCIFFKNFGNSQDVDDLIELTRHPHPIVIAAAVEALKKLGTGDLKAIIAPLINNNSDSKELEAIEQLYISNASYNSSNISNVSRDYFLENHDLIIDTLKNSDSELEITRILRLIKKYGNEDDAELAKKFLDHEMPNVVRTAIKTVEKFDPEYLCVYLPLLLQNKNNKIRISAVRAFNRIDSESIENTAISYLSSLNSKQRDIGITIAMLVDFEKVRDNFLYSFSNETDSNLLDKIGLVFAANPDRYLVKDLYCYHKSSKTLLNSQREEIIKLVSEKVSFALGGKPTANELIQEAKKLFDEQKKSGGDLQQNTVSAQNTSKVFSPINSKSKKFISNNKKVDKSNFDVVDSSSNNSESLIEKFNILKGLNSKAKVITILFILGTIMWGFVIALLISKMF